VIVSGARSSGLEIPFSETDPVRRGASPRPDSDPELGMLQPGAMIAGRYCVLRKIADGGMGVLYACEDMVLERAVAVKLMQRAIANDPVLSERLLREARLAAQLKKHVAQVFDCGTLPTGEPYIVMELLRGRDLYSILRDTGPLAPSQLANYMLEVCAGLEEAHERGIIHRDLKPENLFCAEEPDGSVVLKIVDFGVSKQLTSDRMRAQTNPTESVGSPQYMSPEQITTPSEVDPRTDIWSLGVVMFELLTGCAPFNGKHPAQVCASVLRDPIPPFSDFRNDLPPALEAIVLRCLERNRARRFQRVTELAHALSSFLMGNDSLEPEIADPASDVAPRRASLARRWLSALGAVAIFGACASVLVMAVREGRIRLPTVNDIERLPAKISAWRLPFLSPAQTQAPAPAAEQQNPPAASPPVAVDQRPLAPDAPLAPAPRPLNAAPAPVRAPSATATATPSAAPTNSPSESH
jgi:serine/threonine-protein kinase